MVWNWNLFWMGAAYCAFIWVVIRWMQANSHQNQLDVFNDLPQDRRSPTGHHWVDDWARDVERRRVEALDAGAGEEPNFWDVDALADKRIEEALEAWLADQFPDESATWIVNTAGRVDPTPTTYTTSPTHD